MKVSLSRPEIDLKEYKEVKKVFKNKWLINGPNVKFFENKFKKKFNYKYSASVSSCTSGLELVLKTLKLKKNDEVILSSFNFIAAGIAIKKNQAKPIFIDQKKNSFEIDFEDLKKKINSKTKAILLTHFNGYLQNSIGIRNLIKKTKHKIFFLEDCAHVLAAEHKKNIYSGSYSDAAVFSFGPTKMITSGGMGGMVISKHKELIKQINILKSFGMDKSAYNRKSDKKNWEYNIQSIGANYRMTEIQAAFGLEQLKKVNYFKSKKNQISRFYQKNLNNKELFFQSSNFTYSCALIYFQIIFRKTKLRDLIANHLNENKIGISVHWDPILEKHDIFKSKKFCINSYDLSKKILSIPLYPSLKKSDQIKIVNLINYYLKIEK
jgi:dTDP-4-amino-4,6-dideoxygalactose transaminase